jgi:hypothetical protein
MCCCDGVKLINASADAEASTTLLNILIAVLNRVEQRDYGIGE